MKTPRVLLHMVIPALKTTSTPNPGTHELLHIQNIGPYKTSITVHPMHPLMQGIAIAAIALILMQWGL